MLATEGTPATAEILGTSWKSNSCTAKTLATEDKPEISQTSNSSRDASNSKGVSN